MPKIKRKENKQRKRAARGDRSIELLAPAPTLSQKAQTQKRRVRSCVRFALGTKFAQFDPSNFDEDVLIPALQEIRSRKAKALHLLRLQQQISELKEPTNTIGVPPARLIEFRIRREILETRYVDVFPEARTTAHRARSSIAKIEKQLQLPRDVAA